jgi:hypothetical protein
MSLRPSFPLTDRLRAAYTERAKIGPPKRASGEELGVRSFGKGCVEHVELQTTTDTNPPINIAVTAPPIETETRLWNLMVSRHRCRRPIPRVFQ